LEKLMEVAMFDYSDILEWTDYENFDNLMAATG
jgi:hypothetical protein